MPKMKKRFLLLSWYSSKAPFALHRYSPICVLIKEYSYYIQEMMVKKPIINFWKKSRVSTYISFHFNVFLHILNNMLFVNLYGKKDAPFLLKLTQKIIINCRWILILLFFRVIGMGNEVNEIICIANDNNNG